MKAGYYRPAYYHTLKAGLDADGNVVAWQHRIVGQSIVKGTSFEAPMTKNGVDDDLGRGRVEPPLRHPQPRRRPALAGRRRAGAVVALGRLDAHRLLDRDVHRRARAGGRQGPGRISPRAPRQAPAPSRRSGPRGARSRLGNAARPGPGGREARPRRGRPRVVQFLCRAGRRGHRQSRQVVHRRSRGLRGRLRHRGQSRQRPGADGRRHRFRPLCGAVRGDHDQERGGRAVELPRLPGAADRRDAQGRGPHRRRRPPSPPASASRERR